MALRARKDRKMDLTHLLEMFRNYPWAGPAWVAIDLAFTMGVSRVLLARWRARGAGGAR